MGQIHASVQVTIPVDTLSGLTDDAALLAGYGPIDPDTARRLARAAPGWERVFERPDTKALLTVDRYQPTAATRRLVEVRDETCRFPHCTTPARSCEKDHTVAHHRGGPTVHSNLAALCRPHHMLRHHSPWTPVQTAPGVIRWTSPLGDIHETIPPPVARHRVRTAVDPPPF